MSRTNFNTPRCDAASGLSAIASGGGGGGDPGDPGDRGDDPGGQRDCHLAHPAGRRRRWRATSSRRRPAPTRSLQIWTASTGPLAGGGDAADSGPCPGRRTLRAGRLSSDSDAIEDIAVGPRCAITRQPTPAFAQLHEFGAYGVVTTASMVDYQIDARMHCAGRDRSRRPPIALDGGGAGSC
jgi:hypothetical protein